MEPSIAQVLLQISLRMQLGLSIITGRVATEPTVPHPLWSSVRQALNQSQQIGIRFGLGPGPDEWIGIYIDTPNHQNFGRAHACLHHPIGHYLIPVMPKSARQLRRALSLGFSNMPNLAKFL